MTDDLMRAMTRLAERGEPVGVEALVERIDAQLAGHPDALGRPEGARPRRVARGRFAVAGALVLVLALVVALVSIVEFRGAGSGDSRIATGASAPEYLVVGRRAVLAAPGAGPRLLTELAGSLWAAGGTTHRGTSTLFQLDPMSGAVRARITLPGDAVGITSGFGSLWVAVTETGRSSGTGQIVRIDPRTNRTLASISVGTPVQVATGAGAVWVTDATAGVLDRVDPRANRVSGSYAVKSATGVAVAGNRVWVSDPPDGMVVQVDPATLELQASLGGFGSPVGVVVSGSTAWVVSRADGSVTEYPGSGTDALPPAPLGGSPIAAAPAANGGLWVAVDRNGQQSLGVVRAGGAAFVSPRNLRRLGPTAIVPTREGLWILDPTSSTLSLLEAK